MENSIAVAMLCFILAEIIEIREGGGSNWRSLVWVIIGLLWALLGVLN